jgi:hypothetical protein
VRTKHENPAAGGASGTSTKAAEFVLPIVATNRGHYAAPLKISDTADRLIESWADQLARGRLSIPDMPASLRALYLLGTIHGEQSQSERIDRLTYERDVWYFCANNRGKKPGDYLRHQTSQLWNLAVTS